VKIMLTCKEASRIISEGLDTKLPLYKQMMVRAHLAMCKTCGYYKKQISSIKNLLSHCDESDHLSAPSSLPEDGRKRIRASLRQQNQ